MSTLERLGGYLVGAPIASGGMGTVHLGRIQAGPFERTVAIKRVRRGGDVDREALVASLRCEASVGAQSRHVNVVSVVDLIALGPEIALVSDYIHGVSLADLLHDARDAREVVPPAIASAIAADLLRGLHALHEAGPRAFLHRDVAPDNVLVGADGVARLIDFGIASEADRTRKTGKDLIRGKVAYLAPESFDATTRLDRRADLYAAAVVIWEMLANRRLYDAATDSGLYEQVSIGFVDPVRRHNPAIPADVDRLLLRALSPDRELRPGTAELLARELTASLPPAAPGEVSAWVARIASARLAARAELVAAFERAAAAAVTTTVAIGVPVRRRPARRRTIAVVLGLAAAASASVASVARLERSSPVRTAAAMPSEPATPASPASAPGPEPAAEPAPPLAPSGHVTSATRKQHAPISVSKRPPSCDPPYQRDANGNKVYKLECL